MAFRSVVMLFVVAFTSGFRIRKKMKDSAEANQKVESTALANQTADARKSTRDEDGHPCARAYQACCIGYALTGNPCGCKLKGGVGLAGRDCGVCGGNFKLCCDTSALYGNGPCYCNVE